MSETKKLNNADFRKILATQGHHHKALEKNTSASNAPTHAFTHRKPTGQQNLEKKKAKKQNTKHQNEHFDTNKDDDIDEEDEVKLNEILKNYRDRAAERRKGLTTEQNDPIGLKLLGESKEIGGSVLAASSMEARNMQIQKSKYLGGDMEHTHLVKGLDYSLLNKVRNEIHEQQSAGREQAEKSGNLSSIEVSQANNKLAKNICKVLFESQPPQKNDLFARGRMAYLVDLDEEESEVPSTLLRSVFDSGADQSFENINADNLLINKLSQVLAYLRTDAKKKKKGAEMNELEMKQQYGKQEGNIFEGLDEYVPGKKSQQKKEDENKSRHSDERHRSYFDSNLDRKERKHEREGETRIKEQQRAERKRQQEEKEKKQLAEKEEMLQKKKRKLEEEDAYAELYPGGIGMIDAGGESDDDDFSKMDPGNKKPPVKRWDFENQDEYEKYQSQREANPRAAYQYGLKTSGGRKTRKNAAAANERKIDRELEKINKIMEKGVSQNIRY